MSKQEKSVFPDKDIHVYADDMTEEMSKLAIQTSQDAFQLFITQGKVFSTIAAYIRTAFDKAFGKGWNCIVGKNFGAFVTHEIKTYIYFTIVPGTYILLWKA